MLHYTLSNILLIENIFLDDSNNDTHILTDDTINMLCTIEYKFKDRKQYKSKYNNPKPISFSDIRLNLNKLSNKSDNVVAVIGDGAISAGMAYEAMNNAGASKTKMIAITHLSKIYFYPFT